MKKITTLISLSLGIIIAFVVTCLIVRNNAEKKFEEGWAELFDESMKASFPLLKAEAEILYTRASQFEKNAEIADRYSQNFEEYKEIFTQLNREASNTTDDKYANYLLHIYNNYFISSIPYGRLTCGSKLRKEETKAFWKIESTRQGLADWEEYKPQEFIKYCQNVKVKLMEALRDLYKYKYKSNYYDENSWSNIGPQDSYNLHQEYYKKKNWPFTYNPTK